MATVTRADLAQAVSEEVGLLHREARVFVDMLIEEMAARLAAGEEVKLSSFGSFRLRDKAARTGRNPKTREAAAIAPRRVVTFRASQVLKSRIARGMSDGATSGCSRSRTTASSARSPIWAATAGRG